MSIFLYLPNLIGYVRIILAIASFYYINQSCLFFSLYAVSCLLDAIDGYAARYLNQSTRFGAVLDMVTDRATTAGLLCHLCVLYPDWKLAFQILNGLDLSSHYMHMYASLSKGQTSHKSVSRAQVGFLLWLYYSSRIALFVACAGNELFYLALYLVHHQPSQKVMLSIYGYNLGAAHILTLAAFPIWAFKQFMNVVQLVEASKMLASLDATANAGPLKSKRKAL